VVPTCRDLVVGFVPYSSARPSAYLTVPARRRLDLASSPSTYQPRAAAVVNPRVLETTEPKSVRDVEALSDSTRR